MDDLPQRQAQILSVHASFIHMVVFALLDPAKHAELEQHLHTARQNGWGDLVAVIQKIRQGDRSRQLLQNLDEEDRVITDAILRGLQNPESLPPLQQEADPRFAAPGIASLIQAASTGDTSALKVLGEMAGQMANAGGSMARLGAAIKKLLDGERDLAKLSQGMDENGRNLVESILINIEKPPIH